METKRDVFFHDGQPDGNCKRILAKLQWGDTMIGIQSFLDPMNYVIPDKKELAEIDTREFLKL